MRGLEAAVAFVLLAGVGAADAGAAPEPARVGPRLQRALEDAGADGWVAVGVTLQRDDLPGPGRSRRARVAARQQRVLDTLPPGAFQLRRRYQELSGVAGLARRTAVDALARHAEVRNVYLDGRAYPTLGEGVPLIGADDAHTLGATGAGVNVAVLDTGIDTDHADLSDDLVAEECFCAGTHPSPNVGCCPNGTDTQSGSGAAEDDNGHGTSVCGIITSGGVVAPLGVAPDAGIVAVRVSGPAGALFSDIAAGLDWVLAKRNAFADPIRVVNLSLSDGEQHNDPSTSPCNNTNTADAIEALHGVDVISFASSGNDGFDDGISFPACNAMAVSVGGVYDASFSQIGWGVCTDTGITPDTFVCHSNSDEILDLLAPNYRTATSGLGGGLQSSFGGTSASSAYAAAQAALIVEADSNLTPDQILALLSSSGPMVTDPDNGLSFPRSDVGEAVTPILAVCGNGVLEPGEDCDDGGTVGGDCCAADCSFEAPGASCDDADACTTGDACDGGGACQGAPLTCDDANPCSDDSCNPGSGCVFTPNSAPCDDGDACTNGDTCSGGSCQPGPPLTCGDANLCTDDSCDPASGCVFLPNADPCDDGDACTSSDSCSGGSCLGGRPPTCDDANLCTDDSCDSGSGCVFTPNSAACEDGDACTSGDTCSGGSCVGGPPTVCDDGEPCTVASCDSVQGCVFTPVEGCSVTEIPAVPGPGLVLLRGLILASGILLAGTRLR